MDAAFTAVGTFNQGDVLVSIDPADYQVAVSRAQANLASANAQLDMEKANAYINTLGTPHTLRRKELFPSMALS